MELRNLETFVRVCENMSFSKAAEQLGYAQSTVTAQISQLEDELGTKLFDRIGKKFSLNEKGEELLRYANQLTALAQEAQQQLSDTQAVNGFLRIGTFESISTCFLPPVLADYVRRFPDVRISVSTGTGDAIREMLHQNQIDLMLVLDKKLYDPDWSCAWEKEESLVFLCAPQHPFAGCEHLALSEVLAERMILTERQCNYRRAFEQSCAVCELLPRAALEIGSIHTILDMTAQNLGICVLPYFAARKALETGMVAEFKIKDMEIRMKFQLIYRKSKWLSPAAKAFCECLNM
ncbi:MAG: LysR family transcriptional regulator [Lachnospiraceae bacterium]|nr:LysR family transcriptional regulator [Lachnospiraceae bacterium]